jgi:PKD domain
LKPRLKHPFLAVAVGSVLVAGAAVYAGPALAAGPVTSVGSVLTDDPTDDPSATPTPSDSAPDLPAPSDSESATPVDSGTPSDSGSPDPSESAPDPEPSTSTPPVDTVAPTGSFKLNLTSIWVGQKVTLTQGVVSDDTTPAASIVRVVKWGDGTSSTLTAGQAPIAKQYPKAGKFTVTFTVADAAGNTSSKTATVTVATPGKFKLDKTSVWHHQSFKIAISSVPSGTTKIVLDYGDGYTSSLSGKNQTVSKSYYHRKGGNLMPAGAVTVTARFTNKNGTTGAIVVGKVTIKKDSWNPVVKITKPKNANKVSSWSTVHGTASDKGSGLHELIVVPLRASGNTVYCFTSKKKWMKLYSDSDVAQIDQKLTK